MSTIRYSKTYTSIHASNKKTSDIHWPRVILAIVIGAVVIGGSMFVAEMRDKAMRPQIESMIQHHNDNNKMTDQYTMECEVSAYKALKGK